MRKVLIFSILLLFFFFGCATVIRVSEDQNNEIKEGNIHLILDENTGSFSLSYLTNPETMRYEPLFNSRRGANYTSINVNGRTFHLGSRHFQPSLINRGGYPAFVFESPTLTITQVFTPVATINSHVANGIMISYIIQNTDTEIQSVGLRMLIDTELRERGNRFHFTTTNLDISKETLISGFDGERYWVNRGNNVSLMGSIANPMNQNAIAPDFVHFANWRKLSDSRWRLRHINWRSFGGDSAVAYIYEPQMLESGNFLTYTIFLTAEDTDWYYVTPHIVPQNVAVPMPTPAPVTVPAPVTAPAPAIDWTFIDETQAANRGIDLSPLLRMQERLNQFIAGEIVLNEQDLLEIERTIERYRNLLR